MKTSAIRFLSFFFLVTGLAFAGLFLNPAVAHAGVQDASLSENDFHAVGAAGKRLVAVGDSGEIFTSFDGTAWEEHVSGTDRDLNDVVTGAGLTVAVGAEGTILISPDGLAWTETDSGADVDLNAIAYGAGQFVVVGDGGTILTSEDGSFWTSSDSNTNSVIRGIAFGDGRFVAGGDSNTIVTSSNGIDWTLNSFSGSFGPVAYGNGHFMVAREGGGVRIRTDDGDWVSEWSPYFADLSYDPATARFVGAVVTGRLFERRERNSSWREIADATNTPLHGVIASGGRIVAVGEEGAAFVLNEETADPGSAAESQLHGVAVFENRILGAGRSGAIVSREGKGDPEIVVEGYDRRVWSSVAGGNERVVAVGRDGTIAISEDGLEWKTLWDVNPDPLSQVVFEDGLFRAVGDRGVLLLSDDGIYWERVDTGNDAHLRGIAFGKDRWVMVGASGVVLTSTDGVEWSDESLPDSSIDLTGIAFGTEGFVAAATDGTVLSSGNAKAESWASDTLETPRLFAVAFGNERYIAVGGIGGDSAAFVSEDADDWEQVKLPDAIGFFDLIFAENTFLVSGGSGTILSSIEGAEWMVETSSRAPGLWGIENVVEGGGVTVGEGGRIQHQTVEGEWQVAGAVTSRWLWDVASGDGKVVAVGDGGVILRSEGGQNWEVARSAQAGEMLGGVVYGDGTFVAVGDGGAVLTSADAIDWAEGSLADSGMFWSVAHGDGVFLAAGEDGVVASSSNGVDWDTASLSEAGSLHAVEFTEESGFVVFGSDGFVARSSAGEVWEPVSPLGSENLEGAAYGTGALVAVGAHGAVLISGNGKDWEGVETSADISFHDVVVGEGGATAVGASGTIEEFVVPPVVRWVSGDIEVARGEDLALSGEAGGTPPYSFVWTREGEEIGAGDTPDLSLLNVQRDAIGDYRLQIENDAGYAVSEPVFVTVLTSFEEWRDDYFEEPDDERAAPDADGFGTGVANLIAYATDLDPFSGNRDLPTADTEQITVNGEFSQLETMGADSWGDRYLTLTFPRAVGANDVVYLPEVSGNLSDWSSVPETNIIRITREGSREIVTIRDNVNVEDAGGLRFFRLRVEFIE